MNRREFVKLAAATTALGAVAPKVLAQPAAMGVDTAMAGASRVAVGGTIYEIALDIDWKWKWVPVSALLTYDWKASRLVQNVSIFPVDTKPEAELS